MRCRATALRLRVAPCSVRVKRRSGHGINHNWCFQSLDILRWPSAAPRYPAPLAARRQLPVAAFFVGHAVRAPAVAWHRRVRGSTLTRPPTPFVAGSVWQARTLELISSASVAPAQRRCHARCFAGLRSSGFVLIECRSVPRGPSWPGVFVTGCSSSVDLFTNPCVRPTSASQARGPDSPDGLRPLPLLWQVRF